MELNDFIEHFISVFDEVPTTPITGDTDFKNEIEEWDSLMAMGVISKVDDEYGVALKAEDLRSCTTIRNLFELVKSRR
jgi:acyl carrier protein